MRKFMAMIVLLALICTLQTRALGAENQLVMEDVTVQPGETVYITWKLSQPVTADVAGVTFSYDAEILQPLQDLSTWAKTSVIQDFDFPKNAGVWAAEKPVEFTGEVCTVAFRVVTDAKYFDTTVTCTLLMKNNDQEVCSFTDTVTVSVACQHSFGEWTENEDAGHGRVCALCGSKQTAPHTWDGGVAEKDPQNANQNITTFTCTECQAQRKTIHGVEVEPTVPETVPATTQGSGATKPVDKDDHDHDHENEKLPTQGDDHDHDHDHETGLDKNNIPGNVWVFGVVVGGLLLGAVWILKKKR